MDIFQGLSCLSKCVCSKELKEDLLELIFKHACLVGDEELVELLSSKLSTVTLDDGFLIACENGFTKIAQSLIEHGATNVNAGLKIAQKSGHSSLVEELLKE